MAGWSSINSSSSSLKHVYDRFDCISIIIRDVRLPVGNHQTTHSRDSSTDPFATFCLLPSNNNHNDISFWPISFASILPIHSKWPTFTIGHHSHKGKEKKKQQQQQEITCRQRTGEGRGKKKCARIVQRKILWKDGTTRRKI